MKAAVKDVGERTWQRYSRGRESFQSVGVGGGVKEEVDSPMLLIGKRKVHGFRQQKKTGTNDGSCNEREDLACS